MLKRSLHFIFAAWIAAQLDACQGAELAAPRDVPGGSTTIPAESAANSAVTLTTVPAAAEVADREPPGTVRLVGATTDIGTKYSFLAPPIPFPPFSHWHRWLKDHRISVHCGLEWKDAAGQWHYSEMRSSKWDSCATQYRVGLGQFPCTGYIAYGVYIFPGRYPRTVDHHGRPVEVKVDEVIHCDYRRLEAEIRKYGAYGKRPGDPGTGGYGKENCGLGGPAYKPAQNSNTLVNFVLCKCGVHHAAPENAVGWDTRPTFPYSTDTRFPKYDNQP